MNTHHLNDRVVLIHSILQYQFIQTDRCLNKDTSQTLKSNKQNRTCFNQYQFTSYLMPQEQKQ